MNEAVHEEIEELIRARPGLVMVQLTEPCLESSQQMEQIVGEIAKWRADCAVIHATFALHGEWARRDRVYGSPSTLVFSGGRLCVCVRGRVGPSRLRETLARAGLV